MFAPVVTLLTDYGSADEYAGICRGVIATIAPDARVIDISHGVPPFDVRAGARMLRASLAHMPAGVHVAIVDPGVGASMNRAVAVRTRAGRRALVGPDNGLLPPAAAVFGGVVEAVELPVAGAAPTFHGRDVYAPAAGRLASGEPIEQLGEHFDPDTLTTLPRPPLSITDGTAHVCVAAIDRFGNVILDLEPSEAPFPPPWRVGPDRRPAELLRTFSDVAAGELIAYTGSSGLIELAVNRASAATELGVTAAGETLELQQA